MLCRSAYFVPYMIAEIIMLIISDLGWLVTLYETVTRDIDTLRNIYALPIYLFKICLDLYFLWIVRSYQIQVRGDLLLMYCLLHAIA